jgi:hypothetical protein
MEFRHRPRFLCFWSFILLVLWNPGSLAAQAQVRDLNGQVLDPSGAAVTNASVTVTTPAGAKLATTTNQQGAFNLKGLAPGKYSVEVTAAGFAVYENDDVEVGPNQAQPLKVTLSIEEQRAKVVVSDEGPTLDVSPTNNAGAIVLSGKELEALPDDPDELQSDLTALAGPSAGPNGGQFYIDGFTAGQLPPKSAIREIRINQNPFSAEYDKVGYGRIEIFTKPGTDKWHGQVSVNGNDSAFNSKNPFFHQESADSTYPSYYSVQYSGNVGGPLSKNASFFLNADIRDINNLSVVNAQVVNPNLPGFPIVPFSAAVANPRQRYNIGPRVDYQLTKTNTLSVRYQYYRDNQDNDGIGGFSLPSQGYNILTTEQTLQVSDTQTIGSNVVNETNFQYLHDTSNQVPQSTAVTLTVQGAFNGGGNNTGTVIDNSNHYELRNYTSIQHGTHLIIFGGRLRAVTDANSSTTGFNGNYVFPSIEAYQTALASGTQSASQFLLTAGPSATSPGNPFLRISQTDIALYVEDDWRIRPNILLSYGLRFESQNNISNLADWAPRLGFAWGLGGRGGGAPKTVVRAGFGIFYDRFNSSYVLEENRLNGVLQAQYVYANPDFFPNVAPTVVVAPSVYQLPNLHAPYVVQTSVGLERQLTKIANMSVSYLNSRGEDQFLTNNINIPIQGTYDYPFYTSPTAGLRPMTGFDNVYQFQSQGIYRENQIFVQATVRAGANLMLFSNYTLTYANGDTSSATSFPSNPHNLMQDYGRSPFDIRSRYFMGGTIGLPFNFRLSPFLIVSSGTPYNITLSQDLIGSAQFNQRPTLANGATGPTIVSVPAGTFNTVPAQNATPIPFDYLTSPGLCTLNLRLTKTIGFGGEATGGRAQTGGGGGGRGNWGGGGGQGSPFGGGPRGQGGLFGGGGSTDRRYNLTFSVNARNVFNHVNVATPTGVLNPPTAELPQASASPFFATPNQLAGGSFSSSTANRLIYLQATFSF